MAWTRQVGTTALLFIIVLCVVDSATLDGDKIKFDSIKQINYTTSSELNKMPQSAAFSSISTGFINLVAPKSLRDIITEYRETLIRLFKNANDPPLTEDIQKLLFSFAGVVALFFIGIILAICVPFFGFCFCCCRACGNCGGKSVHEEEDNTTCRRVSFVVSLLLVVGFICFGFVVSAVSVTTLSSSYSTFDKVVKSNVKDLDKYGESLDSEVQSIIAQVVSVVNLAIEKLSDLSDPVLSELDGEVMNLVGQLRQLDSDGRQLEMNLQEVNMLVEELDNDSTQLKNELGSVKTSLDNSLGSAECRSLAFCLLFGTNPGTNQLTSEISFAMINVSDEITQLNSLLDGTLSSKADEVQTLFDNIQDNVTAVLGGLDKIDLADLNLPGLSFAQNITSYLDEIRTFTQYLNEVHADQVQQYSYAGGLAFCVLILIVAIFYVIGICCGELGRKSDDNPQERSTLASLGGCCLVFGWVFSFLLFFLLTISAAFLFLFGGLGEKFICQPLSEPQIFDDLNTFIQEVSPDSASFLANVSFEGLLRKCESNKGVWDALQLDSVLGDDASAIFDAIGKEANDTIQRLLPTDYNLADVIDLDLISQLQEEITNIGLDTNYFDDFTTELTRGLTAVNLTTYAMQLSELADDVNGSLQTDLQSNVAELERIDVETVAPMKQRVDTLLMKLNETQKKSMQLQTNIASIVIQADTLKSDTVNGLQKEIDEFVSETIPDYVSQTVTLVESQVKEDVAGCRPIYNLYKSVEYIACENLMDPFNTLWLGVGTAVLFFLFGIIFSVKLSKFYKKMDYPGGNPPYQASYNNGYDHSYDHKYDGNNQGYPGHNQGYPGHNQGYPGDNQEYRGQNTVYPGESYPMTPKV